MARSEYSQGKKLKVIAKVRSFVVFATALACTYTPPFGFHYFVCVWTAVILTTRVQVNPDIMGGLVVEIGDRTIDLSVSSRIHKMNKLLTDAL